MRKPRSTLAVVLTLACFAPSAGAAGSTAAPFAADGWYTWRVTAVDDAPRWCCLDWVGGRAVPKACTLGDSHFSFGDDHSRLPTADTVQLYAQARGGELVRVRALSPACPVENAVSLTDLGRIDPAASLAWLQPAALRDDSDALAAIAVHRGPEAFGFLTGLAQGDEDTDLREDAVFWLGQVRIGEARDTLVALMFDDPDPAMREKAAFSIAQSTAPDRADLLIRQGREDADGDVRGQAWFWLAESGAPGCEPVIFEALRADPDPDVREDAVFALSQLPDARAVASLLQIVSDAGMAQELREQALFWLVQSDSEEAYRAIDRLFSAAPGR
ncbi:MAG: HEAT repeat domain-containing protein [Xanthomonadales bacterium]|nr:HEAT repeat domain-containing protein [Xanthomonadales bacterium]